MVAPFVTLANDRPCYWPPNRPLAVVFIKSPTQNVKRPIKFEPDEPDRPFDTLLIHFLWPLIVNGLTVNSFPFCCPPTSALMK